MAITQGAAPMQRQEQLTSRQTLRIIIAGCVGIFFELYDNGIFAFMATPLSLVFLAAGDPNSALLLIFAGYAISFFVRPLGDRRMRATSRSPRTTSSTPSTTRSRPRGTSTWA